MFLQVIDNAPMHNLILEKAELLQAHNPKHELLKYLLSPLSNVLWNEFLERFDGSSALNKKDPVITAYNAYYLALHNALTEIKTRNLAIVVHNDPDSY